MRNAILILIGLVIINFGAGNDANAQTWQQTLAAQFDIADTFDHYQDWRGTTGRQGLECISDVNDLPKYSNGSNGIWGKYCYANDETPGNIGNWISDHGPGKQVGSKSIKLGNHGANSTEIKTYIGNGSPSSGYSEIYVFFRLYLPHNTFPTYVQQTANSGGIVGYQSGNPYLWLTGWKFFNIGTGFNDAHGNWNNQGFSVYGDAATWFHITAPYSSYSKAFGLEVLDNQRYEYSNSGITFDELAGIEYHFKLESPAGHNGNFQGNGIAEIWWYDGNGNSTKLMTLTNLAFRPASGAGHLINRLWINGNNHSYDPGIGMTGEYYCGQGMNCEMYVDDFIVDDQRIGPKYYNLLSGNADTIAPNPPFSLIAQ